MRIPAEKFPKLEDVIGDIPKVEQPVEDMAITLKGFAKRNKGGASDGRNKRQG